jgi:peptidoglycan hydrolase-like protein with peptidoglycan-binding domain
MTKSTTAKTAVTASTAAKRTTSKTGAKQSASSYHPAQQQPTQDRYKEIQQALADKGYFGGPVDGNWGPSSMDALKRFQHDQNLVEDGKVGSLSLIALGLGPKRGAASATPPAPAQPASAPPSQVPVPPAPTQPTPLQSTPLQPAPGEPQ